MEEPREPKEAEQAKVAVEDIDIKRSEDFVNLGQAMIVFKKFIFKIVNVVFWVYIISYLFFIIINNCV